MPAPLLAAAGVAAPIIGGLFGSSQAAADREAAKAAYEQSVRDYEAIGIPPVEAQQIVMQQYQSEGKWTPELSEAVKLGDSNMGGVSTDSGYTEAQKQALSKLQDIGNSGGMMLSDQSQLEKSMGNINADERGAREAILQDARQRGGYGSGSALAAQLMNQQNSSNQAHQVGLDVNAQAQKRALEAIMGAGNLGTSLREQQFGEKAQQAAAQDAINQWNAANQQSTRNANVAYQNQAAQYNLGNAQDISNKNVDLKNQQEIHNKGLHQQNFNNQMQVTQGKANARAGQANNATQNAQQTANTWAGIGSGVAQGAGAYAQQQNNNQQRELDRAAYGGNIGKVQAPMRAQVMPAEEDRFSTFGGRTPGRPY